MTDQKYMRPGLDFARGKVIEELGELQGCARQIFAMGLV